KIDKITWVFGVPSLAEIVLLGLDKGFEAIQHGVRKLLLQSQIDLGIRLETFPDLDLMAYLQEFHQGPSPVRPQALYGSHGNDRTIGTHLVESLDPLDAHHPEIEPSPSSKVHFHKRTMPVVIGDVPGFDGFGTNPMGPDFLDGPFNVDDRDQTR